VFIWRIPQDSSAPTLKNRRRPADTFRVVESSIAFVSAHPIVAGLVAWLAFNVAFAVLWHRARSLYRDMEYERDLIAIEITTAEELYDHEPAERRVLERGTQPTLDSVSR
jgi:hypothetical protein